MSGCRVSFLTVVAAMLALSAAPPAHAAQSDGYHMQFEAITDLPVDVGGRISFELPYRIRLSTALGVLPGGYVSLINAIMTAADAYSDKTATLIHDTLQQSLVWRTHVGWQPWKLHGFYFEAGYGMVTLGGTTSPEQLLLALTGKKSPLPDSATTRKYRIQSMIHMIDFELGWQWVLWERLVIRCALGMAATVGSDTSIKAVFRLQQSLPEMEAFMKDAADDLDQIYQDYVFTPVISVVLGYRFF